MSTARQQAQTLIDYLNIKSVREQVGNETCNELATNLRLHLNSCTPEEAEEALKGEIEATQRIIRLSMKIYEGGK